MIDAEMTVRQLWDLLYDEQLLRRFDLSHVWKKVESNGDTRIKDLDDLGRVIRSYYAEPDKMKTELRYLLINLFVHSALEDLSVLTHFQQAPIEATDRISLTSTTAPYPKKFLIELTNNCNLACIMCGVGALPYDPGKTMPIEIFSDLASTYLETADRVRLNGLGESTILPNFLEYLDEVPSSCQIELVTNLTVDNDHFWERLIRRHATLLISCDSHRPQVFEKIRYGSDFSQFLHNLHLVGDLASRYGTPQQLHIIATIQEQNFRDLTGIIELAAEQGIGGVVVNMIKQDDNSWLSTCHTELLDVFDRAYQVADELDIALKLPDHLGPIQLELEYTTRSSAKLCSNPWKEVYIRYNGDVTVCNMLHPYVYGNLTLQSFDEIWNGRNAQLFRYLVNSENRHPYCVNCYYLV